MVSKQDLLRFLDGHVFDPILHASPDDYSQADRKKLKDVQDRTQSEKERFHHYGLPARSLRITSATCTPRPRSA
jgi:hypothetical protein